MTHSINCLFLMLAVAGCGVGVETDPTSIPAGGTGAGSDDPTASQGNANLCPEPDGPRHDIATVAEAEQLLIGRWIQCTGPTPTPIAGSKGLELAADRNYYVLIRNGEGHLVRGTGFSSQGTWNVKDIGAVVLELWPTPSSVIGDTPRFEDNPRRFAFDQIHDGTSKPAIYQAIGP